MNRQGDTSTLDIGSARRLISIGCAELYVEAETTAPQEPELKQVVEPLDKMVHGSATKLLEPQTKRRGRPKGSKNKKTKKRGRPRKQQTQD